MTVIELPKRNSVPLSEPVQITDTFATGVDIDEQPEFTRLIYWSEQPMLYGGTETPTIERVVVAKIVFTRATWDRIADDFCAKRSRCRSN